MSLLNKTREVSKGVWGLRWSDEFRRGCSKVEETPDSIDVRSLWMFVLTEQLQGNETTQICVFAIGRTVCEHEFRNTLLAHQWNAKPGEWTKDSVQ